MSHGSRRVIFYVLLLAFLLLGGVITLYSLGYRLDLQNFSPTRVGGLYVHSSPKDAAITLDGEAVKNKSGLFSDGTFVSGLYPKSYKLILSSDGYREWQRQITVAPVLVTEIKHAVLIPESSKEIYSGNAKSFMLAGNDLLVSDSKLGILLASSTLPGQEAIGATKDGSAVLSKDKTNYFWTGADNAATTSLKSLFAKYNLAKNKKVLLDKETGRVMVQTENSLILLDAVAGTEEMVATSTRNNELENIAFSRYWLAWSNYDKKKDSSRVFLYDRLLRSASPVAWETKGRVRQLDWGADEKLGILDEKGEFYIFTPGQKSPQHLANDGRKFYFSGDAGRVAVFESKSLEIFTFDKGEEEYWRFNLPGVSEVGQAWWHKDNWHIIFTYPGRTMFLDLEDKALQSLEELAPTSDSAFYTEKGYLYYLREGKISLLNLGEK